MASNPLTYTELEAFERKSLISFTVWETEVLMRIDDAVLAAWAGEERRATANGPGEFGYPIDDVAGIRTMVKATAARAKLIAQANAQAKANRHAAHRQKPKT